MRAQTDKSFFITSCLLHAGILLALIFSYEFSHPLMVVENTNQHDVISAVVLGDTPQSKILPHEEPAAAPVPIPKPEPVKPVTPPAPPVVKKAPPPTKPTVVKTIDKDAIALKAAEKKLAAKKAAELKKKQQQQALAKALLADIQKQKIKKAKKDAAANKFAKILREQAELSLRQNLLNENIKLRGKSAHYSQGIVNKYTALITQAIGENWNVPPLVNKSLETVLLIRLSPDGMVLDVKVSKSSGDAALDSSARIAVLKSSPLPVPEKAKDFEVFKQFSLTVSPKNIVQG